MRIVHLILLVLLPAALLAQQKTRPCDLPEGKQFDFWLGEWEVSWKGADGAVKMGTNKIHKVLDSCIVEENFEGGPLKGRSYSVYNPKTKLWQQTWIDNQGGYLVFTGAFKDGKMELRTPVQKNATGQKVISRMVFKNIEKDSLNWDWQQSSDGGITWKDLWLISYKRKTAE